MKFLTKQSIGKKKFWKKEGKNTLSKNRKNKSSKIIKEKKWK